MSILKIEISVSEAREALVQFSKDRKAALEQFGTHLKNIAETSLNKLMHSEMSLFLGQADQSDNKRNGYETRSYALKGIGSVQVRVPIDRKRRFESVVIPKSERIDPRLKEDMAALALAGISSRTLALMSKRILGVDVSHETVAKTLPCLKNHATAWLERPLKGQWWALLVDGTNFRVARRGSVEKEPSLVVLGINQDNRRSILAIVPGTRDSAECWRSVFRSLKARGVDPQNVQIGVMDGLPGLESVFKEEFPGAVTARCWFHAMQNALAKTPKRLHDPFHVLAKEIMYASSEAEARSAFNLLKSSMQNDCHRAITCLEKDLDSLVSHYRFPQKVWHALKTTNAVERIHKEVKRRTRAMESLGESTLTTVLAFTALRLELTWQRRAVDTYVVDHLVGKTKERKDAITQLRAVPLN
jgi:putative transposase